jgi:hypothetical protein
MSLTLILASGPVTAQEPSPAELARRIDVLAQELDALREPAAAPASASAPGLAPTASRVYAAAPGEVSLGAYGEVSYLDPRGGTAEWDLHRVVVYLGARLSEDWLFNSEIEFEHGDELGVEFAYLEGRMADALALRAGHLLVPMGLVNEIHEPTTFPSAERPFAERFVLPSTWHENGLGLVGEWSGVSARAYLMNGFDAAGFDLAANGLRGGRQGGGEAAAENLALVARADWVGTPGLLAGVSAYRGDSGQAAAGPDFATTIFDLHAEWQWRGLRLRGLLAEATVEDAALLATAAPGEDLEGAYLEAAYDLWAGDPRGRALTPFLRVERLDLAADAPGDSSVRALTAGLAWQPLPQVIFKADWTDFDDPAGHFADGHAVTAGFAF